MGATPAFLTHILIKASMTHGIFVGTINRLALAYEGIKPKYKGGTLLMTQ